MKARIVSEISERLQELNLPLKIGEGTDITVNTDFLDAGWSTGKKKISYESLVFVNEQDSVVYMFEKTTEVGQGLSMGGGLSSSFQSGKTLFRKVKSVQYGPDGKAFEFSLDLGAIPKAVKETAKKYGWKFKTVLSKGKALYPDGYRAAITPEFIQPATAGAPRTVGKEDSPESRQPKYSDPQKPLYAEASKKGERKGSRSGFIGMGILGVLMVLILLVGKATITGWAVCTAAFAGAFFLKRRLSEKGFLVKLLFWVVAGFVLLVLSLSFTTQEVSATTARVKNAQMTTGLESPAMKPLDKVTSYPVNAPEIVVSAELRNTPVNTRVLFVWKYLTADMEITQFQMDSGDSEPNIYIFNNIHNNGRPWPQGEYRVDIYVEGREKPDTSVDFEVR